MQNKKLKCKELGASLVEYGLLVALVAVIAIAAVDTLGSKTNYVFDNFNDKMGFAATGGLPCTPWNPCPH